MLPGRQIVFGLGMFITTDIHTNSVLILSILSMVLYFTESAVVVRNTEVLEQPFFYQGREMVQDLYQFATKDYRGMVPSRNFLLCLNSVLFQRDYH